MLDMETMNRCLPTRFKGKLTDDQVESLNLLLTDNERQEELKANLIGFTSVLSEPNYSFKDYVNAVTYVSHKMMGDTNVLAWTKTFPERYQRLRAKGIPDKDINAHVRHYNKTKLVNAILEQSLVPTHILNADIYQEAINMQASIMRDEDVSPKVRSDAANSLLTHLKRPEAQKVELDVGLKENSAIRELKDITAQYAAKTVADIQAGFITAQEAAHREIITVEKDDDDVYS